jgi:hypothetical protein
MLVMKHINNLLNEAYLLTGKILYQDQAARKAVLFNIKKSKAIPVTDRGGQ